MTLQAAVEEAVEPYDVAAPSTEGADATAGPSSERAAPADGAAPSLVVEGAGAFRLPGELQRLQAQQAHGMHSAPSTLHPDAQALLGPLLRLHPANRDQLLRTISKPSFDPQSIPWGTSDKLHDALDERSVALAQHNLSFSFCAWVWQGLHPSSFKIRPDLSSKYSHGTEKKYQTTDRLCQRTEM